ncbi:MAG: GTP-binding protein [Thermoguttaceae bacterium]
MKLTSLPSLICGLLVVSFVGCMKADQTQPAAVPPAATSRSPLHLAVLGDHTRVELVRQIASVTDAVSDDNTKEVTTVAMINNRRVTITTAKSDEMVAHASPCSVADLAVIAVDARNGPMPVHREHIIFARQMHVPAILITLTHSDAIGNAELLELVELEIRELLVAYGWNGDDAIVAYDSELANVQHAAGAVKGAHALSQSFPQTVERSKAPPSVEVTDCLVDVYALAEQEAFPLRTTGISSGEYTLVVGRSAPTAMVQPTSPIRPGETGAARVTFDSPLSVHLGLRCALLVAGHVVAVGVITSTEP